MNEGPALPAGPLVAPAPNNQRCIPIDGKDFMQTG